MDVTNIVLSNVTEPFIYHPVLSNKNAVKITAAERALQKDLHGFLCKLKRKRPEWIFKIVGTGQNWTGELDYAHTFTKADVYEKDNKLGMITVDNLYKRRFGGKVLHYSVYSKRIARKRGPKNLTQTSNGDLAFKTVLATMHKDSTEELAKNVIGLTKELIRDALDEPESIVHNCRSSMTSAAIDYAMATKKQFLATCPSAIPHVTKMEAALEDKDIIDSINKSPMLYLYIDPEHLYVFNKHAELRYQDTPDGNALPEWMRRKLGLLKLVPPKHYVRDVGIHVSDTMFSIIVEQGESND